MTRAVRITPVGPAEASMLSTLHTSCFVDGWSIQSVTEVLRSPGAFACLALLDQVARADGPLPAGFAIARIAADEAELLSIGVALSWRRRGIARVLLADVLRQATASGARAIFLEVAEDNSPARALYAGEGFAPVGRRPDYYRRSGNAGAAALTLRRSLGGRRWAWWGR
jgi:ribosomal-protein-alanine N-acetyltransferase